MRSIIGIIAVAAVVPVALAVDHVALGMQADEAGQFEDAVKHFQAHADDHPDDATAYNNLGVATMRLGIEMMMVRRRLKGKKLFMDAASSYRKSLLLDKYNSLAGENMRGVLHALESNFQVSPSDDDKSLLEEVGYPYDDYDNENAVNEDDPVHQRIKKKHGGDMEPGEGGPGADGGPGGPGKRRRFSAVPDRYGDEEGEGDEDGDGDGDREGREDDERRERAEEAESAKRHADEDDERDDEDSPESAREAELAKIRALKNPFIRAVKLFDANAIPEAVDGLCTQKMVRISPKPKEVAAGKPAFKTVARAAATLKVCGMVIVEDVLPPAVAKNLSTTVQAMISERMASVDVAADSKVTFERTDMAKRSQGRYEFVNPLSGVFADKAVVDNAFVMPILKRSMGPRLELDTFSTVVSHPGAPVQHWHEDAAPLFPRAGVHLPAHGVVSFVALDGISRDMGPTEFVPGSHVQCSKEEKRTPRHYEDGSIMDHCKSVPGNRRIFADARLGSVILFDFRVSHRGGPNTSEKQRPLLYSTYMREWFYDKVNFQQAVSKRFDEWSPAQRKLFNRIEHREYTNRLLQQIRALGGDPEESTYDFNVFTYDTKQAGRS